MWLALNTTCNNVTMAGAQPSQEETSCFFCVLKLASESHFLTFPPSMLNNHQPRSKKNIIWRRRGQSKMEKSKKEKDNLNTKVKSERLGSRLTLNRLKNSVRLSLPSWKCRRDISQENFSLFIKSYIFRRRKWWNQLLLWLLSNVSLYNLFSKVVTSLTRGRENEESLDHFLPPFSRAFQWLHIFFILFKIKSNQIWTWNFIWLG